MSTCTSDANRRRDVKRDFGLAYETKTALEALRCFDRNRLPTWSFGSKGTPSRNLDFGLDSQRYSSRGRLRSSPTHTNAEELRFNRKGTLLDFGFKANGMFTDYFGSRRTREVVLLISILRPLRNRVLINLRVVYEHTGCPPFTSVITDLGFVPFITSVMKKTALENLLSFGWKASSLQRFVRLRSNRALGLAVPDGLPSNCRVAFIP